MRAQISLVLVGVALSLGVAWLVGNTLVARLEREKKLTERDVNALTTFQDLYGTFFSVWKQWGNSPRDEDTVTRLLPAAAGVEGRFEALLVLLSSERHLNERDRMALGAIRQGFQQLREAMKDRKAVPWWDQDQGAYPAMKSLTAYVAVLLRPRAMGWAGRAPKRPDVREAAEAFLAVTTKRFEKDWVKVAESLQRPR